MGIISIQAQSTDHIHIKEAVMRLAFVPLTCLALLLLASPAMAKEKKQDKQMDPQAMMEVWKQMATPGEPHKLFATLAGSWTTTTKR